MAEIVRRKKRRPKGKESKKDKKKALLRHALAKIMKGSKKGKKDKKDKKKKAKVRVCVEAHTCRVRERLCIPGSTGWYRLVLV